MESPALVIIGPRNGPHIHSAYFTWASSPSLSVGYLYAQSGARSVLAHDKATIARIYQSFRLVQPAASATATTTTTGASPRLRYTRFVEPTEHMFTVELPVGWTQAGGL